MPKPKSTWAPQWRVVAAKLRDELGGSWPQVLSAIEITTPGALAKWVTGDNLKEKERRNLALRQLGTWASRGTAPDVTVAPSVATLLEGRLATYAWHDEVNDHTYKAIEILQLRLAEAGQLLVPLDATPSLPAERKWATLVLNGGHRFPQLTRGKLSLGAARGSGLVGTGGDVILVQEASNLRVARVNRVSGQTAEWATSLSLDDLGEGSVLAIDSAGSLDIAFVWAGDAGTAIYRGRHTDGSVELIAHLDSERASAAILHGVRALLALPDNETGGRTCEAFGHLLVTTLVGAASNGRLIVLALGSDHDGKESAWIEVNGRHRQQVPPGSRLELPLGTRTFPTLRDADSEVVEMSPHPTSAQPYEHWMSPLLIGHAATA